MAARPSSRRTLLCKQRLEATLAEACDRAQSPVAHRQAIALPHTILGFALFHDRRNIHPSVGDEHRDDLGAVCADSDDHTDAVSGISGVRMVPAGIGTPRIRGRSMRLYAQP